jgi:alginate O-acetyltransferase complex protein AlgI
VIGSMFMFRLILYMYELGQKDQAPASIWQRVCYFFLLPNICFPLFPIVDYKTYVRTYFNEDPFDIYQKGISWMFRGVVQLILYRIIYLYWTPAPTDVVDTGSLVVYLLSSYMLLLKISGQAHLIVGILCLFGFNLPAIFNNYFLANGFNDFWRRINIYWKDFVMKIFYYRVFFVFRKWGLKIATVITLLFIFFITWMLHSYQFFWLEGTFPIRRVDGLFWGIFGVLIAANSLIEIRKKGRKTLGNQKWTFGNAIKRSFQVVSFFTFMCILWSLWQSGFIREWISTVAAVKNVKGSEIGLILLVLGSTIFIGALIQYPFHKLLNQSFFRKSSFYRTAFVIVAAASLILGCRMYNYYVSGNTKLARFVDSIKEPKLNKRDYEQGERGYYGALLGRATLAKDFHMGADLPPPDWAGLNLSNKAVRPTNNILIKELLPRQDLIFKGERFTTNKWGMRDKDYELNKTANTYRFVIVGSSIEMGSGVNNNEVFESLLEERLNKNDRNLNYLKYEILNFAVGGYDLVNNVKVCDTKIFPFKPDALIYFAHTSERWRAVDRFKAILNNGGDLEYDFLKELKNRAGINQGMDEVAVMKRLLPYSDELLHWGYQKIAEKCHKNNCIPVLAVLPHLGNDLLLPEQGKADEETLITVAKSLGFITIDLSSVYDSYDPKTLVVSSWDTHPNSKGHSLIADLLYKKIIENRGALHLGRLNAENLEVKSRNIRLNNH